MRQQMEITHCSTVTSSCFFMRAQFISGSLRVTVFCWFFLEWTPLALFILLCKAQQHLPFSFDYVRCISVVFVVAWSKTDLRYCSCLFWWRSTVVYYQRWTKVLISPCCLCFQCVPSLMFLVVALPTETFQDSTQASSLDFVNFCCRLALSNSSLHIELIRVSATTPIDISAGVQKKRQL